MLFPNFQKEKSFKFIGISFLVSKANKPKSFINLMKLYIFKDFLNFYALSLFISVKAFLPSLRVLKTSHVKEEIISMVSVIREI